jgi:DNA repair protein RecN (Recombination protein N)
MITSFDKNYALIENCPSIFQKVFNNNWRNWSWKINYIRAIGLVLGKEPLTSLKNKEEKCVIEAHFEISKYNLIPFFEENDLDYENETIIRREILPSGNLVLLSMIVRSTFRTSGIELVLD